MKAAHILFFTLSLCFSGCFFSAFSQEAPYTNSIGMEMVPIPAGTFLMGCDKDVEACYDRETPRHEVKISKPFYMGKYEVSQDQWAAVMGNNPSRYKGGSNPVENVSWEDAQDFAHRLNEKEGTNRYRLPTEAEWEYAARAGSAAAFSFGDDAKKLGDYAWYSGKPGVGTHPVGQLKPNGWGLYDMYGNVWEWVQDWYGADYYAKSPGTDPQGPDTGTYRIIRGGGWHINARHCRSANRFSITPDVRDDNLGFRLVFSSE